MSNPSLQMAPDPRMIWRDPWCTVEVYNNHLGFKMCVTSAQIDLGFLFSFYLHWGE